MAQPSTACPKDMQTSSMNYGEEWKMMWSDTEMLKLIEMWGDKTIQEQLEGCEKIKRSTRK